MLDRQKVYLITSNAESGTLESLPVTEHLEMISNEDLTKTKLRFTKDSKVCIASEVSIETIVSRMDDRSRKRTIESLKEIIESMPGCNWKKLPNPQVASS